MKTPLTGTFTFKFLVTVAVAGLAVIAIRVFAGDNPATAVTPAPSSTTYQLTINDWVAVKDPDAFKKLLNSVDPGGKNGSSITVKTVNASSPTLYEYESGPPFTGVTTTGAATSNTSGGPAIKGSVHATQHLESTTVAPAGSVHATQHVASAVPTPEVGATQHPTNPETKSGVNATQRVFTSSSADLQSVVNSFK